MDDSCANFYQFRQRFESERKMKIELLAGLDADECEQEIVNDKADEKIDLCSSYIPPQTFRPHNFYERLQRHAQFLRGNIKFNKLWSVH